MWPYCVQPLYAFGLPVIVNVSNGVLEYCSSDFDYLSIKICACVV